MTTMLQTVKRIACVSLAAVLFMSGCGNEKKSSSSEPERTQPVTTAPVTTAEPTVASTGAATVDNATAPRKYNFLAIKQKTDVICTNLENIISDNHFQGAVYLKLGNDLEFSRCTGASDEVEHQNNSIHTYFNAGALTKHLTAAAVLKLSEEKRLSLSDKLNKYFKNCSYGSSVKIKDLLTMTSGVPSYTEFSESSGKLLLNSELDSKIKENNSEEENKSAVLKWILSQKTDGTPGTVYRYSDSDFFLLGKIIEQASGTSYTSYIKDNILKPLGVNHSGFKQPKSMASAYDDSDKVNKLTLEGVGYSALGFITNISDTIRYIEGMFDESIINSDSLLDMHTPWKNGYGYGVKIDGDRITLNSQIGAFGTMITYSTDESELFVSYSNYSSSDTYKLNTLFNDYLSEFRI